MIYLENAFWPISYMSAVPKSSFEIHPEIQSKNFSKSVHKQAGTDYTYKPVSTSSFEKFPELAYYTAISNLTSIYTTFPSK
jgi:hypothetical protein